MFVRSAQQQLASRLIAGDIASQGSEAVCSGGHHSCK